MVWFLGVVEHDPALSHVVSVLLVCDITKHVTIIDRYRLSTGHNVRKAMEMSLKLAVSSTVVRIRSDFWTDEIDLRLFAFPLILYFCIFQSKRKIEPSTFKIRRFNVCYVRIGFPKV